LNAAAYQVPYQHCHFLPDFTGYLHNSHTLEIPASRLMDYKQKLKGILPVEFFQSTRLANATDIFVPL
jgi:hypothetical protein